MSPDNQTKSAIEGTETSPPHVLLHLQTSPRMCHSRKKAATHLRRESREDLLVHAAASLTGLHNPSQFRPCLCPRELLLRMVWQEPEKHSTEHLRHGTSGGELSSHKHTDGQSMGAQSAKCFVGGSAVQNVLGHRSKETSHAELRGGQDLAAFEKVLKKASCIGSRLRRNLTSLL